MRRMFTFQPCRRRDLPALLRAQIMLRQNGRCFDCGTRLMLGRMIFDHRPPLALREQRDDANDPERLAAICRACDQQKTPRDLKKIAKTKRLALDHQDFVERMRDKVPGRPVPSKKQWRKVREKMKEGNDG
jgi:5-methylcytosine-specific restriction endonuclease McrA